MPADPPTGTHVHPPFVYVSNTKDEHDQHSNVTAELLPHTWMTGGIPLSTDYNRKQFFHRNFSYVHPQAIHLGTDDNRNDRYAQYIPLKDTLKAILTDPVVWQQCVKTQNVPPSGVLTDVCDGSVFKTNALCMQSGAILKLILYQDAFKVVNPLGSAKKKHKIVGVYFTLANFEPFLRSSVDHLQLLLLCTEQDMKYFGHEKLFSRMLSDIRDIEENGIVTSSGHTPGLPPCIGHDVFEGVVAYDLYIYLRHFIKEKKWMTFQQLNRRIRQFMYLGSDGSSVPSDVVKRGKKIGGQAIQNWCLLRLLPIIIGDKIKDTQDQVHIQEYLETRKHLFPSDKLKPKHHYLLHYPSLIMRLGPLVHLWTMRFESKHSYFKRFLQVKDSSPYHADLYSSKVRSAVEAGLVTPDLVSTEANFRGTLYKKGFFVCLKNDESLEFGQLELVLIKENKDVHFLVMPHSSSYMPEYGLHKIAMNDIDTLIKEALPMCGTPDKLQPILDALQNLGVKTVEDMKLVQKDDLAGVLKPIQERKLLAHVNSKCLLSFKPLKHRGIFSSLASDYLIQAQAKLKPSWYFTRLIFNTDLLSV
ncbi:hypothetical protein H4Q32_029533 [Labeo rohita]|uniref:Uncharacterized protein n=1 Tax=Labeo rohita TaxID=84645 RepID=A0ABQ8KZY8_LABRO|nr:hypothetical protein H4Q32_029533 [Labeo rohita]